MGQRSERIRTRQGKQNSSPPYFLIRVRKTHVGLCRKCEGGAKREKKTTLIYTRSFFKIKIISTLDPTQVVAQVVMRKHSGANEIRSQVCVNEVMSTCYSNQTLLTH